MTTYYVSSIIGDDDNAGTSATSPLATLPAVEDLVGPGDTVEVMNGTYTGPAGGDLLEITTSGTASAPITFEAAPGQTPILDSSGCWNTINIKASYIVIKGFTVVGDAANYTLAQAKAGYSTGSAELDGSGISVTAPDGTVVHHITIENNTVYNEPGGGIGSGGADYLQILNNVVHDNAHWSAFGCSGMSIAASQNFDNAPGPHIIISGNIVYGNSELVPEYRANAITDGEGIILDSNSGYTGGFLVQNNTVYNNGGPGIEAFLSHNAVITGNTVYGNNTQNVIREPSNAQIFINESNNVTVQNNNFDPSGDTTPPGAPTITGFSPDTAPTGDKHTTATALTLTGTGEANSTITIFEGSTLLGSAPVSNSGAWNFVTSNLTLGAHNFTAEDTDAAGNVSVAPGVFTVTIDGVSPPPAGNLVTNGGLETGLSDWTIGSYRPNDTYIISNSHSGAFAAGLGTIGADGSLSQNIATIPGQHYTLDFWLANMQQASTEDFTVKFGGATVLNLANHPAQGYTEYTFDVVATSTITKLEFDYRHDPYEWRLDDVKVTVVDTTPPGAPTITGFSPDTAPTGDKHTTATALTLTGTGEANSTITIFEGSTLLGSAPVSNSGAWNFVTSNLTLGAHNFTAEDTDAAGNVSVAPGVFTVTIDGVSPPPAGNLVTNGGLETGLSDWTIGSYRPNDTYIISNSHSGAFAAGLGTIGADGSLSQNIATIPGQHYTLDFWLANMQQASTEDFTVKFGGATVLNLANHPAQGYTEYTFDVVATSTITKLEFDYRHDPYEWRLDDVKVTVVDTTPPGAPTITGFSPDTAPTGDKHTTATALTLTGTGEANSTITIFEGSTLLGSAPVSNSGAWNFVTSNLTLGAHNFTAEDTDAAGNVSVAPGVFTVTIDGVSPPPAGNLVTNGGLETGLSDWTIGSYRPNDTYIISNSHSGAFAAGLGTIGADGSLSQNIATIPGQHYTLDFWLANMQQASTEDFTVKFGGATVLNLANHPAQGYTEYTFDVVATSTITKLEFDYRHDPYEWRLDDVKVTVGAPNEVPIVGTSAGSDFHFV